MVSTNSLRTWSHSKCVRPPLSWLPPGHLAQRHHLQETYLICLESAYTWVTVSTRHEITRQVLVCVPVGRGCCEDKERWATVCTLFQASFQSDFGNLLSQSVSRVDHSGVSSHMRQKHALNIRGYCEGFAGHADTSVRYCIICRGSIK